MRTLLGSLTLLVLAALAAAPAAAATTLRTRPDAGWGVDGRVVAIVSDGHDVYIGGDFTHAIGPRGRMVVREHLAAFNERTGKLDRHWKPRTNGIVSVLRVGRGIVWAGGDFTHANGHLRHRLAAFRAVGRRSPGRLTRWRPSAGALVDAMVLARRRVYIGGAFKRVDGTPRWHLAAVSRGTGALAAGFAPRVDGRVRAMVRPDPRRLIIAGGFQSVNGRGDLHATAVSARNGAPLPWAYNPPFPCYSLVGNHSTLYCGGAGGGGHLLAFNIATGAKRYVEVCDGDVVSVGLIGDLVVGGGHFENWSTFRVKPHGAPRIHLAAQNAVTRQMSPWNPGANSNYGVGVIYSYRNHLYIGGDFTKVGGVTRMHFARFTAS